MTIEELENLLVDYPPETEILWSETMCIRDIVVKQGSDGIVYLMPAEPGE